MNRRGEYFRVFLWGGCRGDTGGLPESKPHNSFTCYSLVLELL